MTTDRDRVICVSLTEAEWQGFIAKRPQPVEWLREQILGQLTPGPADTAAGSTTGTSAAARSADAGPTRATS